MLNRLQDVFRSFQQHNVKYVIIGGIASTLHGVPRATDVQTSTPGVSFQDAWQRHHIMNYHGQEFYVLSKDDLISSKRAAGREVDLEDVRSLELAEDKENAEPAGEPDNK